LRERVSALLLQQHYSKKDAARSSAYSSSPYSGTCQMRQE
jgi:hypothetical protein